MFTNFFFSFSDTFFVLEIFAGSHNWWFLINCQVTDSWQQTLKQREGKKQNPGMEVQWKIRKMLEKNSYTISLPFPRFSQFSLPSHFSAFFPLTMANKNCQILLPAFRLTAFFARNFPCHQILIGLCLSLSLSVRLPHF